MLQRFSHCMFRFFPAGCLLTSPWLVALLVATLLVGQNSTSVIARAQFEKTCDNGGAITMGKYWLNNNEWGANTGTGWQCSWSNYLSGDTLGWGTTWGWTGEQYSVKSYASIVLGWQWGLRIPNSGLPIRLSANRNVSTYWDFRLSGSSRMDVAYDIWLHTIPNPNYNTTPSDEVMIWLNGNMVPSGAKVATNILLAGTTWDLYEASGDWQLQTFVRTTNTTTQSLNLKDFFSYLIAHQWLVSSKYLTSVQGGIEVYTGDGELDTNAYSVTIS